MNQIRYRSGYKYQLKEDYADSIGITPVTPITTDFIDLDEDGNLIVRGGYAWDGPSGPTYDSTNFMRGSLVHDALYQLMREEHLDYKVYRVQADKLLAKQCREDGMSAIRAWTVYQGVHFFADPAAAPAAKKPTLKAPV